MTAEEAQTYGLVDRVVAERPALGAGDAAKAGGDAPASNGSGDDEGRGERGTQPR